VNVHAVIGMGFGDEGKGHVVDMLCQDAEAPVVVRFSGGHQAGHHVVMADGREHVFSSFGSGTFRGASTQLTKYVIVSPVAIMNELAVLKKKGVNPYIFVNPDCPVTTPVEIWLNHQNADTMGDGSCGVGIFETVRREQDGFRLRFGDLYYPSALRHKLRLLEDRAGAIPFNWIDEFLEMCGRIVKSKNVSVRHENDIMYQAQTVIFEGSQGLLLDQNHGFFPHVTPSNTGTQNIPVTIDQIWMVTRAYQTRHGNGPMSPIVPHQILPNKYEHNLETGYQGRFRQTILDLDLLGYASSKDEQIRRDLGNLVINCMDLVQDDLRLFRDGVIHEYDCEVDFMTAIGCAVGAGNVFASYSPIAEKMDRTPAAY